MKPFNFLFVGWAYLLLQQPTPTALIAHFDLIAAARLPFEDRTIEMS
jgi:hypothetical protein